MMFDPTEFNFVLLRDYRIPPDVSAYELKSHAQVNGAKDFLRINIYLTKDRDYVSIWNGLLDVLGTESEFESGRMQTVTVPEDFDFNSYTEVLFRGYIETRNAAEHVLAALRIPSRARNLPQVLTSTPDGPLRCVLMGGDGQ